MIERTKYSLYLDESGNFGAGHESGQPIKDCLVGGILIKEKDVDNEAGVVESLFSSWERLFTGEKENLRRYLFHATELYQNDKNPESTLNAEVIYHVLRDSKDRLGKFVIFDDQERLKIIDTDATYLNILTEGIIQLLKRLVFSTGDPVDLTCVIGKRKDTEKETNPGQYSEGNQFYIARREYVSRINERLTLEKARLRGRDLLNSKIEVAPLKSDKEQKQLIIADHICHFWFTHTKAAKYKMSIPETGGRIVADVCAEMFDEDYIFPLLDTQENAFLQRLVMDDTLGDALYELCAREMDEKSEDFIFHRVLQQPDDLLEKQLDNLVNYINHVIQSDRDYELSGRLISNAEKIAEKLKEEKRQTSKFDLDLVLLRITILDHQGKMKEMEDLFQEAEPLAHKYVLQTMNIDYHMMFYNRLAVFQQDKCDYEGSLETCERLEEMIQSFYVALSMDPAFSKEENALHNEQLGKVQGTSVQAYTQLLKRGEDCYEDGKNASDQAISNFTKDSDKARQYQYRAVMEAAAGHYGDAIEWIEKYYKKSWADFLKEANDDDIFGVSNLLDIADDMLRSHDESVREKALSIADVVEKTYLKKQEIDLASYPGRLIYIRLGHIFGSSEKTCAKALNTYLGKLEGALHADQEPLDALMALEVSLYKLQMAFAFQEKELASAQKKFSRKYDFIINSAAIPETMKKTASAWKMQADAGEFDMIAPVY